MLRIFSFRISVASSLWSVRFPPFGTLSPNTRTLTSSPALSFERLSDLMLYSFVLKWFPNLWNSDEGLNMYSIVGWVTESGGSPSPRIYLDASSPPISAMSKNRPRSSGIFFFILLP